MKQILVNKLTKIVNEIYTYVWFKILRIRLKNKNFTLITPNCIGGVIYHRLGLQFLSPTINLFFPNKKQYLEFVSDLKKYLSESLQFIETDVDYPVAILGGIEIRFNHYKTKEEAYNAWERRKKRVKYDNLFIIMDDVKDIDYEDIKKFGSISCTGKVLFTAKNYPEFDYVLPLSKYKGKDRVGIYMTEKEQFTSKYPFDYDFDFVKWLNTGKLVR